MTGADSAGTAQAAAYLAAADAKLAEADTKLAEAERKCAPYPLRRPFVSMTHVATCAALPCSAACTRPAQLAACGGITNSCRGDCAVRASDSVGMQCSIKACCNRISTADEITRVADQRVAAAEARARDADAQLASVAATLRCGTFPCTAPWLTTYHHCVPD